MRMKKIIFSQEAKNIFEKNKPKTKNEFIGFVGNQLKKITERNLKIPIQLYQL